MVKSVPLVPRFRDFGLMETFRLSPVLSSELSKLVPEIYRGRKTASGQDAITVLTSYTGGRKVPFRNLRELESALTAVGEELHSGYILSYQPDRDDPGYHRIRVEVARRDVVVHTRPGYYMDANSPSR